MPRLSGFFYGWVVVGGAFLVLFLAYGTQYAFGVFFSALLEEFGWSRAGLSGVFSLYAFLYCAFGLVAGQLTDRWGPRLVIASGGVFLSIGLAGMSQVRELWHPYLLYGVVAAIGMSTAYVPCNATVVKWFVRQRGLAVGIASSGGSLGTFALPPVAHLLVGALGWRRAYVVFGAGILVSLNLVATVMKRDPEVVGLAPDGAAGDLASAAEEGEAPWPLRRAIRTTAFWMVFGIFAATWIPVFIPLVHVVPFARDLGISALLASTVVSVLGIAAALGRLVMGAVSDRIGRKTALAISIVVQGLAFGGFMAVGGLASLYLVGAAFGFSYGAISTLFPAIVGDFFGRAEAGHLVGFLFALSGSLAAVGPVVAGAIYDATGRYTWAFLLSAAFNALALALLTLARPPEARPAS
ncbi:MAG: MFS transporter [Candidatus Rokubacteria bacterium]|nr:MFS transporter [Candidatus Rokubacteria bacterium]